MNHHSYPFITIEGIEGVGKSTALEFIAQLLKEKGISYVTTREPGGTEVAEQLRQVLLKKHEEPIYAETELLLLFAGRKQHIEEVILPALKAGKWVICDRFTDATYAYQGGGRGISETFISQLEEAIQQGLKPMKTLLLDAPVQVSQCRLKGRKEVDRIEVEKEAFFQRVRDTYLKRAEKDPLRYHVIRADKPLLEVQQDIRDVFHELF